MSTVRIALANLRVPTTREESASVACAAVAEAGQQGALVVCFPECYVPGYRWPNTVAAAPDAVFLARGLTEVAGWQDKGQLDPSEEPIYPAFAACLRPDRSRSAWSSAMKDGDIRRPCSGRCDAARRLYFTRTHTLPSPGVTVPRRLRILPTRFTKRRCSVAQRRIRATSPR